MLASLLSLVVLSGGAGAGAGARTMTCEPAPEVTAAMAPLFASADLRQNEGQRAAGRAQLFVALRARFPGDLHVEDRRVVFEKPSTHAAREAFAAPYRERAAANPGDAGAAYLAGLALNEWNTGEAIGLFKRALALDPALAQAHSMLAEILSTPAFANEKQAAGHRRQAFALCPLLGLDFVDQLTAGQRRQLERLLAARLDRSPGLYLTDHPSYWQLLFRQARPRAFPKVRERVRQQLQAIERLDPAAHPYRSSALIEGWKLVGDRVQVRRAEDEQLRREPHSEDAQALVASRWEKQQQRARLLAESEGWIRQWPESSWAWQQRVIAVFADGAKAPALELPTIEGALRVARDNPKDVAWEWPLPMVLAARLIARGRHLDRVPGAVAAGLPIIEAYLTPDNDHYPNDAEAEKTRRAYVMWPVWRLVSRGALERKHAADATTAVDRMSAILAPLKPPEDWREFRAELAEARARLALIQQRRGEALALLKQSLAERTAGKLGAPEDELMAVAAQQMRAEGASEAAVKQWRETTVAQTRAEPQAALAWKPQSRRLPGFTLDALDGRVWSLRALRDKVVFVNIWSRGCGACLLEMPMLNELHRRLADRKDVVLLSINVESEAGGLPLFLADRGVEYPVLLGERYIDRVVPQVPMPTNWVIDGRGVLRAEQIGYYPDVSHDTWLAVVLAEIEKAKSAPTARVR